METFGVNSEATGSSREERRLAALDAFEILDTPRETVFDEVADLASRICGTSIAVVNLIGTDRQFFKAEVGLGVRATPLEASFCATAILEEEFLLVPDATQDPRFACNPLVTGAPHLRFYAGAILRTDDGLPIGTVCVLDTEPRTLDALQQQTLRVLARQVMTQLKLRLALRHRVESETRQRESEEKLRFAMQAARQGAWELDLATWTLIAPDRCKPVPDLSPGAPMAYDDHLASVHPDDRQRREEAIRTAIATGGSYDIEYRYLLPDGGEGWVHVTGRPTFDAAGRPVSMLGVWKEISARKADELALKALNETLEQRVEAIIAERELAQSALRQSQKMEAMGQLTGGVAHDFNNLLTPIIGSLDLLQRRPANTAREARLIDGALQSAERARLLVQRLLAFARRQPLQSGAVDVAVLIHGMIDLIRSTSGAQFMVRADLDADLPPALADGNQLEMAILNLAVNARDAMPGGGTLTIAAKHERHCPLPDGPISGKACIRLSVIDTGTGMDAETMRRAIEPFYSTKGIGKGTGLGLSMVHGLALQLGGAMTINSTPGLGTRVDLWLPLSQAPLAPPADPTAPACATGRKGRVLVVDDEELVRMTTADMLQSIGYEAVEVASAVIAERMLRAGEMFDLIVTDHLMPGISGAELAARIRASWPALKVLIVSGYADVDGIAPDFARLAKPFREAELARAITELV